MYSQQFVSRFLYSALTILIHVMRRLSDTIMSMFWTDQISSNELAGMVAFVSELAEIEKRAFELQVKPDLLWAAKSHQVLSVCQYFAGDYDGSMKSSTSFVRYRTEIEQSELKSQWWLMALLHKRLGHDDIARDFAIVDNRQASHWVWSVNTHVNWSEEFLSVFGEPSSTFPSTGADLSDALNRLIALYPDDSSLFRERAILHIESGNWQKACDDLRTAVEKSPRALRIRCSYAIATLRAGKRDEYDKACLALLSRLHGNMGFGIRREVLQLCCLTTSDDLPRDALATLAASMGRSARADSGRTKESRLAQGLVAFRLRRYEEALDLLPFEADPPWEVLPLLSCLFRAMALHHTQDEEQAVMTLENAISQIQAAYPSPVGPPVRGASMERTFRWAVLTHVRKEAEALLLQDEQTE